MSSDSESSIESIDNYRRNSVALKANDSMYVQHDNFYNNVNNSTTKSSNNIRKKSNNIKTFQNGVLKNKADNDGLTFVPKSLSDNNQNKFNNRTKPGSIQAGNRRNDFQITSNNYDYEDEEDSVETKWIPTPKRFLAESEPTFESHSNINNNNGNTTYFSQQKRNNNIGKNQFVVEDLGEVHDDENHIQVLSHGEEQHNSDDDNNNIKPFQTISNNYNNKSFTFNKQNSQSQKPDSLVHNSTQENGFEAYIKRSESKGIILPRKSGRYDETGNNHDNNDSNISISSPNGSIGFQEDNPMFTNNRLIQAASNDVNSADDNDNNNDNYLTNNNNNSYNNSYNNYSSNTNSQIMKTNTSSKTSSNNFNNMNSNYYSFVLTAHLKGYRSELVHCTVIRDRTSIHGKLYPSYELILEETKKTIIIARKMNLNRTSNYHLFDMTRGQAGKKLSKKNGNYLGKLRARSNTRTEYVLLNQSFEREEVAGIAFDKFSLLNQIKEGNLPRKLKAMIPPIDQNSICIPHRANENGSGSILDMMFMKDIETNGGNDPVFENGNYRLNFNGRVSMPSVKNFQLVSPDDIDNIICQFGKVDEDVFHLDFKAPLNAFQAFGLALCQFNL
eukprot:gene12854-17230_t